MEEVNVVWHLGEYLIRLHISPLGFLELVILLFRTWKSIVSEIISGKVDTEISIPLFS